MFPPGTPISMDYIYQVMIPLYISVSFQALAIPWTTYQVMIP
jgi:hypothetical protein